MDLLIGAWFVFIGLLMSLGIFWPTLRWRHGKPSHPGAQMGAIESALVGAGFIAAGLWTIISGYRQS